MLKTITGLLIVGAVTLVVLGMVALSEQPVVDPNRSLSHQHIAHVRQVLKQHLAEQQPGQTLAQIQFSEQDLNVIANYLLQRTRAGAAKIRMMQQALAANISLPISGLSRYLNIHLQLKPLAGRAETEHISVGQLPLPAFLGDWFIYWMLQQAGGGANLHQQLQSLHIQDNQLALAYRYDPALVRQVKQKILNLGEPVALQAYVDKLNALQQQAVGQQRQLVPLLQSLFAYAQMRSQTRPPVQENVALLGVLGVWAGRQKFSDYAAGQTREPRAFNLKLHRRIDAARHFLISAAFAVRGDHQLARAIGVAKELADAEAQSGFSFTDLAANEAGIAFGLLATESANSARYLQGFMARGVQDADIMPPLDGLPENLDQGAFQQRFGGVGQPAYRQMMEKIQRRLDVCLVYQQKS